MLKVTLIEDNMLLRETMEEFLSAEGHDVSCFASAEEAAGSAALQSAQVVVLDLNLPGENGISLARRLRQARPDLGIVMLTARTDPAQRQQGYESGADIYLTKPSSPGELAAALRSLARRLAPVPAQADEDLRIDTARLLAIGPGGRVTLSAFETDLLRQFGRADDRRLSFAEIAALEGSSANRGALDVRITRLRKKLAQIMRGGNPIVAIRGTGYQLTLRVVEGGGPFAAEPGTVRSGSGD
ncbi:MAG: transcriptional regulator [Rhodobacter sp. CACIA14H1]|nr:MAG: transcriptional regulator [Rhodobacter sp. CACIA14H1]